MRKTGLCTAYEPQISPVQCRWRRILVVFSDAKSAWNEKKEEIANISFNFCTQKTRNHEQSSIDNYSAIEVILIIFDKFKVEQKANTQSYFGQSFDGKEHRIGSFINIAAVQHLRDMKIWCHTCRKTKQRLNFWWKSKQQFSTRSFDHSCISSIG